MYIFVKYRWQVLSWLLLLVLVGVVEHFVGWGKVLAPWRSFSLVHALVALALLVLGYALRAWRLYNYFPEAMGGYWGMTWRLMLTHNMLNNLLPARTGELSFPLLMKRDFGVSYTESAAALFWFRLLDLHMVLGFAIFPMLMAKGFLGWEGALLLGWLVIPLVVYAVRGYIIAFLADRQGRLMGLLHRATEGLPRDWPAFFRSWAMTWANWVVKILTLAWLLGLFLPDVDWERLLTAVSAGELTSVLPVHAVGGFGTYESGIIAVLMQVTALQAAMIGAVNLHLFILGTSILGGVLAWGVPLGKKNHG